MLDSRSILLVRYQDRQAEAAMSGSSSFQLKTCDTLVEQVSGWSCEDGFVTCGKSEEENKCTLVDPLSYEATSPVDNSLSCGSCQLGYEGVGCHIKIPSYTEMVNGDARGYKSMLGERMRMSIQVPPSNNAVELKLKFTRSSKCVSAACKAPGRIWVRARLGSQPPDLIHTFIVDQASKTMRLDSNGHDREFNSTSSNSTGSTTLDTRPHITFSAAQRSLLAFGLDTELDGAVYRNDAYYTTNDSISIKFPDVALGFTIPTHELLYVDIYHGNMYDETLDPSVNSGGKLTVEDMAMITTIITLDGDKLKGPRIGI